MIRILTALALLFALSGCVATPYVPDATLYYTPPPPVEQAAPDAYDPDFDATFGAAPDVSTDLIPGQSAGQNTDLTAAPDLPLPIQTAPEGPELERQRAACASEGGQLTPRGAGFFVCVHQTRDGGRQCVASADCEGVCLARSRTCAPMRPILGCQEVFTLPGRREIVCTE